MVLEVLNTFPGLLNIVSDSLYVVNAVNMLEVAGLIKPSIMLSYLRQVIVNVVAKPLQAFDQNLRLTDVSHSNITLEILITSKAT